MVAIAVACFVGIVVGCVPATSSPPPRTGKVAERALRRELIAMASAPADGAAQPARMREIFALHGWPGRSRVGADGSTAAWLIVQRSNDLPLQREALVLLEMAASQGEASLDSFAHLKDRVLVFEGKKQLYGTQFKRESGTGALVPFPVEDPANLESRRKAMGLPKYSGQPIATSSPPDAVP